MKTIYKKMLEGLKEKETQPETWYVYILKCSDNTFYTGITKDLQRRLEQHNSGKGARYTRSRQPSQLLYSEKHPTRSSALIREAKIKALSRPAKAKLSGSPIKPPAPLVF